jgi:hypothetical protein
MLLPPPEPPPPATTLGTGLPPGKSPTEKFLLEKFVKALERQRLSEKDFKKYLEEGIQNLKIFYKFLNDRPYLKDTKTEVSFYNENIKIEDSHIYGNIDMLEKIDKEIILTDFKTGDYFENWEDVNHDGHKIKSSSRFRFR